MKEKLNIVDEYQSAERAEMDGYTFDFEDEKGNIYYSQEFENEKLYAKIVGYY